MLRFRPASSQHHSLPKRHRHDNQRLPHGLFMGQLQIWHRMEVRSDVTQRSSSDTMSSGRCIQFHSAGRFPVPNPNLGLNHQRSSTWRLGNNWTVFMQTKHFQIGCLRHWSEGNYHWWDLLLVYWSFRKTYWYLQWSWLSNAVYWILERESQVISHYLWSVGCFHQI